MTRFYASLAPPLLTPLIQEFLEKSNVQCKPLPPAANERGVEVYKLRIGGKDARKEKFKGWVEVEKFTWNGVQGSFCLMKEDEVCVFFGFVICALIRFLSVLGQSHILEAAVEVSYAIRSHRPSGLMSCASETARGENGNSMIFQHLAQSFYPIFVYHRTRSVYSIRHEALSTTFSMPIFVEQTKQLVQHTDVDCEIVSTNGVPMSS